MTTAAPDKNRGVRRKKRPSNVLFGSLAEHRRGLALAGPSVRGYTDDSSGPPKASGATITVPESYVEARVTEPKAPDPPTEANTKRLAPDSAPGTPVRRTESADSADDSAPIGAAAKNYDRPHAAAG